MCVRACVRACARACVCACNKQKCTNMAITTRDNDLYALTCVRNLGTWFIKQMTMEQHVKSTCRAAYDNSITFKK